MSKNVIRSIRKGSVQWNEEGRLDLGRMLLKCGYSVKLGREQILSQGTKGDTKQEYVVEFWEE